MEGKHGGVRGIANAVRQTFSASLLMAVSFCVVKGLYGILPAVYVVLYARFIDNILLFYSGSIAINDVLWSALPVIAVTMFQYCGGSLAGYFQLKCTLETASVQKMKFMDKCSRIPYAQTENSEFRDLMYSVENGLEQYVFGGLYYGIACLELVLNMLSILVVILQYSVGCALAVCVCFVPVMLISVRGGREDYAAYEKYQAAERRLNSYEEMLSSDRYADERLVYGYAGWVIDRWKKQFDEASGIFLQAKRKNYIAVKVTSLSIKAVLLVIVGVLVYTAVSGGITLGVCTMLITQILAMSSRMTWNLSAYLQSLFSVRSYMQNYEKFYAAAETVERKGIVDRVENIEFKNVSFRYGENLPYVLKNLSFSMEAGSAYALVGENGAGKTTIMKLLLGLYEDYEGNILVNGTELREIANLNKVFSPMFQDYARYEISIRDNICLSEQEGGAQRQPGDEKLLQLMGRLKLDLSMQMAEKGLEAEIGRLDDENRDLSGGQWQRLAMLRALVHPGEFLLLDEPTAALDPAAENAIYQDFKEMLSGRSALLITHRLGAARLSDRVLVLQGGHMAEQGTHDELLARGGVYAQMFKAQKEWYQSAGA